jgi:hypothetical protein
LLRRARCICAHTRLAARARPHTCNNQRNAGQVGEARAAPLPLKSVTSSDASELPVGGGGGGGGGTVHHRGAQQAGPGAGAAGGGGGAGAGGAGSGGGAGAGETAKSIL